MRFFNRRQNAGNAVDTIQNAKDTGTPDSNSRSSAQSQRDAEKGTRDNATSMKDKFTPFSIALGAVSSCGGFLFGYESGQISGFLQMTDFKNRFAGGESFTPAVQGAIVALLCGGTLVGCLLSGWLCDKLGRRRMISFSAFFYIIGVIIEISSQRQWGQFAAGRFVAGLGIGALSTSVPMYQSESVPKTIRGPIVGSYQLCITLGIWTAYMINWGTSDKYANSAQWRIPSGLAMLWALILGSGIWIFPESPRYDYCKGETTKAKYNLARIAGVAIDSPQITAEFKIIEDDLRREREVNDTKWYSIFLPKNKVLGRVILGMILQAGQQLTGANYFFYYGTTIFKSTGLKNSYVTSIILGTVNVVATFFALWIMGKCGRRNSLMTGAAVMCTCLIAYSLIGSLWLDHVVASSAAGPGALLIVFTCIFIAAFAVTWGPMVWAVVAELYPIKYRASALALATAANWLFNFLISFFSTFIVARIGYYFGLVFGGCCLVLFFVVYFFVVESLGRSLEDINEMYEKNVNPRDSKNWVKPISEPAPTENLSSNKIEHAGEGEEIKENEHVNQGTSAAVTHASTPNAQTSS